MSEEFKNFADQLRRKRAKVLNKDEQKFVDAPPTAQPTEPPAAEPIAAGEKAEGNGEEIATLWRLVEDSLAEYRVAKKRVEVEKITAYRQHRTKLLTEHYQRTQNRGKIAQLQELVKRSEEEEKKAFERIAEAKVRREERLSRPAARITPRAEPTGATGDILPSGEVISEEVKIFQAFQTIVDCIGAIRDQRIGDINYTNKTTTEFHQAVKIVRDYQEKIRSNLDSTALQIEQANFQIADLEKQQRQFNEYKRVTMERLGLKDVPAVPVAEPPTSIPAPGKREVESVREPQGVPSGGEREIRTERDATIEEFKNRIDAKSPLWITNPKSDQEFSQIYWMRMGERYKDDKTIVKRRKAQMKDRLAKDVERGVSVITIERKENETDEQIDKRTEKHAAALRTTAREMGLELGMFQLDRRTGRILLAPIRKLAKNEETKEKPADVRPQILEDAESIRPSDIGFDNEDVRWYKKNYEKEKQEEEDEKLRGGAAAARDTSAASVDAAAKAAAETKKGPRFTGNMETLKKITDLMLAFKNWYTQDMKGDTKAKDETLKAKIGNQLYTLISGDFEGYKRLIESRAEREENEGSIRNLKDNIKQFELLNDILKELKIDEKTLKKELGQAWELFGEAPSEPVEEPVVEKTPREKRREELAKWWEEEAMKDLKGQGFTDEEINQHLASAVVKKEKQAMIEEILNAELGDENA